MVALSVPESITWSWKCPLQRSSSAITVSSESITWSWKWIWLSGLEAIGLVPESITWSWKVRREVKSDFIKLLTESITWSWKSVPAPLRLPRPSRIHYMELKGKYRPRHDHVIGMIEESITWSWKAPKEGFQDGVQHGIGNPLHGVERHVCSCSRLEISPESITWNPLHGVESPLAPQWGWSQEVVSYEATRRIHYMELKESSPQGRRFCLTTLWIHYMELKARQALWGLPGSLQAESITWSWKVKGAG